MRSTKVISSALLMAFAWGLIFFVGSVNGKNEGENMSRISEETVVKVFQKKIYFGHQSVGNNILQGISLLAPDYSARVVALESLEGRSSAPSAFYHSRVGSNSDPKSKVDDFVANIRSNSHVSFDVAFLKFCYVDVKHETNVEDLFAYYQTTFAALKKEFPEVVFVHFTIPLTTNKGSWKTEVKKLLGKDDLWEYADNIKRNQYNLLLLNEYQGKEPVFDLAVIESTRPDGQRESFNFKGRAYYALAEEYTRDGGHLNEDGSKVVGAALLEFLAEI
jgi:hypothetical protein